jgi:membrane glycosyltransferase
MTRVTTPSASPSVDAGWRRLLVFGLALGTTFGATTVWADLLGMNGTTWFDRVQVALFAISFGWVAIFFWSSIFGWLRVSISGRTPGLVYTVPLPPGTAAPELQTGKPVAIVIPIYNEEPQAVFARVAAMYLALEQLGNLAPFHFFVLSDTTNPDIWVAEEIAWIETMRQLKAKGRIFYRRRLKNTARKAGNIADFCTKWGAQYEHMIVLDADSLLTGECLLQLARFGRLNPKAGIIQGLPTIIGAQSFYARAQQFAARLYGPILAAGINFWHLGDGNYWGHNAVIRVDAFTQCCGLPTLPGPPPLGGHILSHDFVEAALIRRGGWQVWLVGEIPGCFEQMPQSLIENGKRERRWVQGNLQHSKLLRAPGLHPLSRLHLFMGILAYLAPVLGLLFLFTGLASAIYAGQVPPDYFPDTPSLFPVWPVFDGDRALQLLFLVLIMLTLPKLLAALTAAWQAPKAWGGRLRLFAGVLTEHVFTILIAPIMMLIHTSFVLEVLRGKDSGWGAQNRGDARTSWREAWQRHRFHMAFGVALAGVSWFYAPALFWWLSPIVAGLLLALPLSVYSSRALAGFLFRIPEETRVPSEWQRAGELEGALAKLIPPLTGPLGRAALVLDDAQLNAQHLALLPEHSAQLADPDELAKARRKLALRVEGKEVPVLSNPERMALLLDSESLSRAPLGLRPQLP